MLVFYHFAAKSGLEIERYDSQAEGAVEKTRNGLRFANVSVRVQVKVQEADATRKLAELAELAERFCLVSNSVSCPVSYNVTAV